MAASLLVDMSRSRLTVPGAQSATVVSSAQAVSVNAQVPEASAIAATIRPPRLTTASGALAASVKRQSELPCAAATPDRAVKPNRANHAVGVTRIASSLV